MIMVLHLDFLKKTKNESLPANTSCTTHGLVWKRESQKSLYLWEINTDCLWVQLCDVWNLLPKIQGRSGVGKGIDKSLLALSW